MPSVIEGWLAPGASATAQVDFDAGEVRLDVGSTENREGRVFPFTKDLRRLLEAQKVEHDRLKKTGHICPNVFFREVAERRGGKKRPQRIISFNKACVSATIGVGGASRVRWDRGRWTTHR